MPRVKKARPVNMPSENQIHASIIEYLATREGQYPWVKWIFHPANGGYRTKRGASLMKRLGVRRGVSDLICLYPKMPWHGFVCEVKDHKGKLTPEQIEFLNHMQSLGVKIGMVKTLDSFIKFFEDFVNGK